MRGSGRPLVEAAGMGQEAEDTPGLMSDPEMGSHTWEGVLHTVAA